MPIIDLAIERSALEGVVIGNVQVLLREKLPASAFVPRSPFGSAPFGDDVFQAILTGRNTDPRAPDDGLRVPFSITSIDVLDARLLSQSSIPAPGFPDDGSSDLDDVELPGDPQFSVLVPRFAPTVAGDDPYESVSITTSNPASRQPAVALNLQITIQSAEGIPGRPVRSAWIVVTVFVVLEIQPASASMGSPRATSGYSLQLMPRLVNVRVGANDLVSLMRFAYLAARTTPPQAPPPGSPSEGTTAAQWRAQANALREAYDGMNETLATNASFDLNDLADALGVGNFVPNAGITLTPTQLRLKVQIENEAQWRDPRALDDLGAARDAARTLMRDQLVNSWRSFLAAPDDVPIPPGTSLAVHVDPYFVLNLLGGALRNILAQRSPDSPIARAVFDLRQSLDRQGVPRFVLPFSGIALVNDYLDRRIERNGAGGASMTWEWTLRFLDICPLLASDIDIDFRLSLSATSATPVGGGTSETDLQVSVRLDFDINDWDAFRCAAPLLATFLPLVAHTIGLAPPVLALLLAVVAQSLARSSVGEDILRGLQNSIDDAVVGIVSDALSVDSSRVAAEVHLDGDGMSAVVRIADGPALLWSGAMGAQVTRALAPLGLPERVGGPYFPDAALRVAPDGGLVLGVALPAKAYVLARLVRLLVAEDNRNAAWVARYTLGPDASEKFAWAIDRCRIADDDGNPLVSEARYSFSLAQSEQFPWAMRVFSVDVVQTPALRQNLALRFAVDRGVFASVPAPTTDRPVELREPAAHSLRVTLAAPRAFAARLATSRVDQTLIIAVSTNVGRLILTMERPFDNLVELLPLVTNPGAFRAEVAALQDRCLLGRPIPGAATGARSGGGGPLPAGGDIASVLLSAFGPVPRFGDGDVREGLGLGLPREIINPAAPAGAMEGAFRFDGFAPRLTPGASGGAYGARDIARLALEAGRG